MPSGKVTTWLDVRDVDACETGARTGPSPAREGARQERARAVREQEGAGGSGRGARKRRREQKGADEGAIRLNSG